MISRCLYVKLCHMTHFRGSVLDAEMSKLFRGSPLKIHFFKSWPLAENKFLDIVSLV